MTGLGRGSARPPVRRLPAADRVPLDPATAVIWFDALLRHTTAAAAVKDAAGVLRWANTAFGEALGLPTDLVLGRTWSELQPPGAAARHEEVDRRVLRGTAPVHWRLPVHRDRARLAAAGTSFPVDLHDGQRGVATTFATEAPGPPPAVPAHADRVHRDLFEGSATPTLVYGTDHRVRHLNEAGACMLGSRAAGVRGRHVLSVVTRRTAAADADRWLAVVAGRLEAYRTRAGAVRQDGSIVVADTVVSLVRDTAGAPAAVIATSSPEFVHLPDADADDEGTGAPPSLSPREVAVLEGIAAGRSSQQLARLLGVSQKGVDYHVKKLGDLLDAPNRTALVARAYASGVLLPHTWPPRAASATAPWNHQRSSA